MTRDEYLEFIRHQPYDSMGDFSFLLDEKADSSENTATQAVRDNIPSTGLRFFTVYGPAGRPDMAYFGFTNKLVIGIQ